MQLLYDQLTDGQYECCYLSARGEHHHGMQPRHRMSGVDAVSSVLSSDVESLSVVDSEDTCSRSAQFCVTCVLLMSKQDSVVGSLI